MAPFSRLRRAPVALVLVFIFSASAAQDDEIPEAARRLTPAETQRLKDVLAAPLPSWALPTTIDQKVREKEVAARMLGDEVAMERLLREAIARMPAATDLKKKLADWLVARGRTEEGIALMQDIALAGDPVNGAYTAADLVCLRFAQNPPDVFRSAVDEVDTRITSVWATSRANWARNLLTRAKARLASCQSLVEERWGHHARAVEQADEASRLARSALKLYGVDISAPQLLNSQRAVASTIVRKVDALRSAGRIDEAEATFAEGLEFVHEIALPDREIATIYRSLGDLRFEQRRFVDAEAMMRKAVTLGASDGTPEHPAYAITPSLGVVRALVGQQRWVDALGELQRLDARIANSPTPQRPRQFTYERALVAFGNQRHDEAARLFESLARGLRLTYGGLHHRVAEAEGMQGAALWRSGSSANRARALALLKSAVGSYMHVLNADFLTSGGIHKELRQTVFEVYIDALTATDGEDVVQAIGAADWLRGGAVQGAVNDAAVRAAASTPERADLVRQDQDLRHEIEGLRRSLAGELGVVTPRTPPAGQQLRAEVAALESKRLALQSVIRERFPEYSTLTRPVPPTQTDIARHLHVQQSLMVLLPTASGTYIWALSAGAPAQFVKARLNSADVGRLVARLREHLDLGGSATAGKDFDLEAAYELYDRLFAPVRSAWQGKSELVIAAAGALDQLPMAVLQTRPGARSLNDARWFIREISITQTPSLTAWVSIKRSNERPSAPQAFLGWGDPQFSDRPQPGIPNRSAARNLLRAPPNRNGQEPASGMRFELSSVPALPETREELLNIAQALGADVETDVILGAGATRSSVLRASQSGRLASRRVLAFATHGLRPGDLPQLHQPALLLAHDESDGRNPGTGLLTLQDVLGLKLNADWVVLSACNTASPDGQSDESLSGLARGFIYAGARRLLVTHWAVESASATLLTTATFRNYAAQPNGSASEHLRQAMLQIMASPRYAHPAYWAPYAMVGDGGSAQQR